MFNKQGLSHKLMAKWTESLSCLLVHQLKICRARRFAHWFDASASIASRVIERCKYVCCWTLASAPFKGDFHSRHLPYECSRTIFYFHRSRYSSDSFAQTIAVCAEAIRVHKWSTCRRKSINSPCLGQSENLQNLWHSGGFIMIIHYHL